MLILYFPFRKAASYSRYTHCHSRKLEFISKYSFGQWSFAFLEPIDLLGCLIYLIILPLFWIMHSLHYVFHPYDNTTAFLSLSLIAPYAHCLIFVWLIMAKLLWRTNSILPVECKTDPRPNITLHWSEDLHSTISEFYLQILNLLELTILLGYKLSTTF